VALSISLLLEILVSGNLFQNKVEKSRL